MDQALSFHDAEYSREVAAGAKPARVTRRRKSAQALVRVPMLDWPSDLFSDNAGIGELMSEDWAPRCDPLALSYGEMGLAA